MIRESIKRAITVDYQSCSGNNGEAYSSVARYEVNGNQEFEIKKQGLHWGTQVFRD